jgi:radical SAM protein with 4Fe4S-binding SPASM domain
MNFRKYATYIRALSGILHGGRAFGGPIRACITLTNKCNIRCIHCYFYSPYVQNPNFLQVRMARMDNKEIADDGVLNRLRGSDADTERTHELIEELINMGTRSFIFTGGEPLLHKNALAFIRNAKHHDSTCLINTNGTMLDNAMIDELIDLEVDNLKISTMAGTPELYANTHPDIGNDVFERLKQSLKYIAERKAALGVSKPKVTLAYIVISQNFDGILDFSEFARLLKADRVIFRPVDDIEDPGLRNVVPNENHAISVRQSLIKAQTFLEGHGIAHNIDFFLRVFKQQLDTTSLYQIIPCYYGWLWVRVNADGFVYPCCRCYQPLGDIHKENLKEIWNGNAYNRFRQDAIQLNKRKSPVKACDCYSCSHFTGNLRVYRGLHPARRRSV